MPLAHQSNRHSALSAASGIPIAECPHGRLPHLCRPHSDLHPRLGRPPDMDRYGRRWVVDVRQVPRDPEVSLRRALAAWRCAARSTGSTDRDDLPRRRRQGPVLLGSWRDSKLFALRAVATAIRLDLGGSQTLPIGGSDRAKARGLGRPRKHWCRAKNIGAAHACGKDTVILLRPRVMKQPLCRPNNYSGDMSVTVGKYVL